MAGRRIHTVDIRELVRHLRATTNASAVQRTTGLNRRARFYSLTALGRKHLTIEASRWNRLVESIARVMEPGPTTENA